MTLIPSLTRAKIACFRRWLEGDEELTAVGVGSIRQAQNAGASMFQFPMDFVIVPSHSYHQQWNRR